jgi:hypothetical protein
MTKLHLAKHEIILKIYSELGDQPEIIEIKNGSYNKKVYASLVMSEGSVILEGDEMAVLATGTKAVTLQIKNNVMKLAELLNNDSIYIDGINAIPEGRERELLQALLEIK